MRAARRSGRRAAARASRRGGAARTPAGTAAAALRCERRCARSRLGADAIARDAAPPCGARRRAGRRARAAASGGSDARAALRARPGLARAAPLRVRRAGSRRAPPATSTGPATRSRRRSSASTSYRIGADRVGAAGAGRARSRIVDSGLDLTHRSSRARPDTTLLNAQQARTRRVEGYHGTSVASVGGGAASTAIGAVGVYPQAALRVFDARRASSAATVSRRGIDGRRGRRRERDQPQPRRAAALAGAMLRGDARAPCASGALVVAASGNEFERGSPVTLSRRRYPHVLTVGVDRPQTTRRRASRAAARSSTSPRPARTSRVAATDATRWTSRRSPARASPPQWWPPRQRGSGRLRPELDATQMFEVMRRRPRDVDMPGFDDRTGFGMLDMPAALGAAARRPATCRSRTTTSTRSPRRLFASGEAAAHGAARAARRTIARAARRGRGPARRLPRLGRPGAAGRLTVTVRRTPTYASGRSWRRAQRPRVTGSAAARPARGRRQRRQARRADDATRTTAPRARSSSTSTVARRGRGASADVPARGRRCVRALDERDADSRRARRAGELDVRLAHAHAHALDREARDERVGDRGGERLEQVERAARPRPRARTRRPRGSRPRPRSGRTRGRVRRRRARRRRGSAGPSRALVVQRRRGGRELEPASSTSRSSRRPPARQSAPRRARARRGRGGSWRRARRQPPRRRGSPRRARCVASGSPSIRPSELLREKPTSTGRPSASSSSSRRSSSKLCSTVLPKPMPGIEADPLLGDPGRDRERAAAPRGTPRPRAATSS